MRHRIRQVIFMITVFVAMILYMPRAVYASDGTISISSTASTTGNEVSISVSVSGNAEIGTVDLWLTYDPSIIEAVSGFDGGGGGRIHILSSDNTSFTVKFKTVGVGDSTINIDTSTTYVYNYNPSDGDYMNYSVSPGKVSVNAPKTYSGNNNLKTLVVSPGTLTPQFQTSITEYNLTVPKDCERLNVSAQTEDNTATVAVSGTQMDYGDNTTYIKVTAENGETKTYIIYTKREGEEATETETSKEEVTIDVKVGGETYHINTDYETHPLPEGFEEKEYVYKKQTIKAGIGISKKLVIFYLEKNDGEEENGSFYIYNEEADEFYKMINLTQAQGIYTIIDFKDGEVDIPAGYQETDEIIDGISRKVYVGEDKNSFLIYLMNYNGECGWYRIDRDENTIQRYFAENITSEEETTKESDSVIDAEQKVKEAEEKLEKETTENQNRIKKMFIVIIILAIFLIFIIFSFLAYILKMKGKKEDREILEEENNTQPLIKTDSDTSITSNDTYENGEGVIEKDERTLGNSVSELIEEWDRIDTGDSNSTDEENMELDKTQYIGNTLELVKTNAAEDDVDYDNNDINESDVTQDTNNSMNDTTVIPDINNTEDNTTVIPDINNTVNDTTIIPDISNTMNDTAIIPDISNTMNDTTVISDISNSMNNTTITSDVSTTRGSIAETDIDSTKNDINRSTNIQNDIKNINSYEDIELNKIYEDTEDEDSEETKSNTKIVINENGETVMLRDGVEVQDDDFIDLDDN